MELNKYRSVIIKQAEDDIAETLEYISKNLFNPTAAENLLTDIIDTIDRITMFPYAMPTLKSELIEPTAEYRKAEVNNFVLIYKVIEELKEIRIMAVFYGPSDIVSRIKKRV